MGNDAPSQDVVERIRFHAEHFDTRTQAVIATTLHGRIVYWNAAASRIYGWREHEVLGRDIVQITPNEVSNEAAVAIMERLRAGATWSGEFAVRRRDGRRFLARVQDVPVRDERGELIGIVGISAPSDPLPR